MPPQEAYYKLRHVIDEVNNVIQKAVALRVGRGEGEGGKWGRLSPEKGNVCFSGGVMGWCFTLESFAKIYWRKMMGGGAGAGWSAFAQRLWGGLRFFFSFFFFSSIDPFL